MRRVRCQMIGDGKTLATAKRPPFMDIPEAARLRVHRVAPPDPEGRALYDIDGAESDLDAACAVDGVSIVQAPA